MLVGIWRRKREDTPDACGHLEAQPRVSQGAESVSSVATIIGRLLRLVQRRETVEMAVSVANQLLVSGMTFLIGIAAARLLGLEQFGRFSMVLIAATLVQGLQNSVLNIPMMTLSGLGGGRTVFYFRGVMLSNALCSIAGGIVIGLVLGIGFGLRDGAVPWSFATAAAAYAATQNYIFTGRRLMFARRDIFRAMALDIARYAVLAGIVVALWRMLGGVSVEGLLWALALSAFIAMLPYATALGVRGVDRRLLSAIWGRHWPFARWLMPMTLVTFAQEQAVTLSLGFYLSDEAVGGLRAGQYLLGATHFLLMALENVLPAGAARAFTSGGRRELKHYLLGKLAVVGVPVALLIGGLAYWAGDALELAFGEPFRRFAPILHIFAVSYAFIFVRDIASQYFRAIERTDVILKAFLVSCIIAALMVVPALKLYDVIGAALLILAINVSSMLYVVWAIYRDRPMSTLA